jgi:hypothetical protein
MSTSIFRTGAAIVISVASLLMFLAFSSGRTGSTSTGCTCHGSQDATVSVIVSGPTSLAPSATGNYTITVTKAGTSFAGVDIAVTGGATLSTTDAKLQLSNSEITHNQSLTPGTAYNFKVTAPASGASFAINAVGVASPSSSGSSGTYNFGTSINVALPIQLASFTGALFADGAVQLQWKTVSEISNYGFYVQRSAASEGPFADLSGAFIAGNGTTSEPKAYSYTDASAGSGSSWYYRLRQVNLDGSQSLTDPIRVTGTTSVGTQREPLTFALAQNYPNPFNPTTVISYSLPAAGRVGLKVYDVSGKEVATLVSELQEAGLHHVDFSAAGLASGVYLYRLEAGNMVAVHKMILMK